VQPPESTKIETKERPGGAKVKNHANAKRKARRSRLVADERVDHIFSEKFMQARERREVISLICRLFLQGKKPVEIKKLIEEDERYSRYAPYFHREDAWRLIRRAAQDGWLEFAPPLEVDLAEKLARLYSWRREQMTVVASPMIDDIAARAADKLLEMIRRCCRNGNDPVHIGFAGGRMLRRVAQKLAKDLRTPSADNPERIVFHAMVAAFDEEHFESDPNNFVTYFLQEPLNVDVSFIRLPAPRLVETELRRDLERFAAIRQVYERAKEIHIIVTGGGSWADKHGPFQGYMAKTQSSDLKKLNELGTVGDLLWQPMSSEGPIDMEEAGLDFRTNTLVDLGQLPELIAGNVDVLFVLGPCSRCLEPHGEVLDAILSTRPALVTDVVTDVSNVHDLVRNTGRAL
jgi:DNA-binding transcriptional regulator LsrR (DeoR family)